MSMSGVGDFCQTAACCRVVVIISEARPLCRRLMQNASLGSVRCNEGPSSAISTRLHDERSLRLTSRVAIATAALTPKSAPVARCHRKLVFAVFSASDAGRTDCGMLGGRLACRREADGWSDARLVERRAWSASDLMIHQ